MTEHYPVKTGPLGGRYVIAKLGKQRKAREYCVQATSDDRIIVQTGYGSKGAIGVFDFNGKGRFTTRGAHFPHLGLAEPFEFPVEFVKACLDVCQPLDAVVDYGVATINHTVQVIG